MKGGRETWLYGGLLALALGGGVYAIVNADDASTAAEPAPRAPAARPSTPSARLGASRAAEERRARDEEAAAVALPEGVAAPALPSVPDLATDPPPPAPAARDPRFATLGVEMRLMSRARELVTDHPSAALELLAQHRAEHEDGVLREAREAFTIEALIAMDRRGEAERRYYDFLDEFEGSEFASRLADLLREPEPETVPERPSPSEPREACARETIRGTPAPRGAEPPHELNRRARSRR